jgi:hypothetical protein
MGGGGGAFPPLVVYTVHLFMFMHTICLSSLFLSLHPPFHSGLVSNRSGVVPGAAGPGAEPALQHLRRLWSADRPALPLPIQQQHQRGAGGRLPVIRRDPAG